MSGQEWLLVLALSSLWGGSFFFFKVLVRELPPFTIVLGRVGLAALALLLIMRLRGQGLPRSPRVWRELFVLGALNNVIPFSLIAFGEARIASGLASILNAATPICTVLVAHFATRDERLGFARFVGVLFGFLGVVVLVGPSALHDLGGPSLLGQLACLGAAVSYGFAGVWGRRFKNIPPLTLATSQVAASTVLLVPLALAFDRPWTLAPPSAAAWGALFGIALLSTALAYLTYFRLLATAGAVNSALVTFLLPIAALLLGWAVLHEHVEPRAYLGMALIGLGLAALDGRPLGWVRSRIRAMA
jgi:drug/metabolite transporter (DMT)-like permease